MEGGALFFRKIALQVHVHWKKDVADAFEQQFVVSDVLNETIHAYNPSMPDLCLACGVIELPRTNQSDPTKYCLGCDRLLCCKRNFCNLQEPQKCVCGTVLCHFCGLMECEDCDEVYCQECVDVCHACNRTIGDDHLTQCKQCDRMFCNACHDVHNAVE